MRHRVSLTEGALVICLLLAAGFLALIFDLSGEVSLHQRVELSELVVLAIMFVGAFMFFGWRRIHEQEREIRRRADAERRATFLADHDHLTGLPNRRRLQRSLEAMASLLPSAEHCHAVFVLDLNGFKKINDLFGHSRGDEVLAITARRIEGAIRGGDVLARIGGDEFAIVARELSGPEGAINAAQRILKALDEPIAIGNDIHRVGTGIGIALLPKDGIDPADLMRKADVALYKAKDGKGSAFAFFEDAMDREARERDELQRDLAAAIGTSSLAPFYQPIIDLKSGRILELEALARWTHPTRGEISPERFIPIAEDSELIRDLTDHLLRSACRDLGSWPPDIVLSFNVSPALLHDPNFGLRTMTILAQSGLPLQRFKFEITENALVRDFEAAQAVLGTFREAGIRIALDDFGTGATSLFHLRRFKFDALKIDRSFIDQMTSEQESAAIVKALIGLGNGLGVDVVAEGVERASQQSALTEDGCRIAQGFLFSKAVSADAVRGLLASEASAMAHPDGLRSV